MAADPTALRLDLRASGADRSAMLRLLASRYADTALAFAPEGTLRGFALAKSAPGGAEVGPLVTEPGDEEALAALWEGALAALPAGPVEAGVPEANAASVRLLAARGFVVAFPAVAMYRGAAAHEADARATGAVAGMEKG